MINYSISERYANPVDVNVYLKRINDAKAKGHEPAAEDVAYVAAAKKAYYGVTQYSDVMELNEFCAHIASHNSKLNKGDIMHASVEIVSCLREQLLAGKKVKLGDLGCFSLSIRNAAGGSETMAGYNPSTHCESLRVIWEPSNEFGDLKGDATFHLVQNKNVQAMMRRIEKGTATTDDITAMEAMIEAAKSRLAASDDDDDDDTDNTPDDNRLDSGI